MAILRPRNRVVYFRLSEQEYEQCVRFCEVHGARSLSDLARAAVVRLLADAQSSPDRALHERFSALEQKLESLSRALNTLIAAVAPKRSGKAAAAGNGRSEASRI